MTPLAWIAMGLVYSGLEYYLGRTDRVKAGSVVEAVLNGTKFVLGAAMLRRK